MSDLSVWTPIVRERVIEGVTVRVEPLKARDFAAMQVAANPVLLIIAASTPQGRPERLSELVGEAHEQLVRVVAIGTKQPEAWLHGLNSDVLLELFGDVMEANGDFLHRRVIPAMSALVARLNALNGAGSS